MKSCIQCGKQFEPDRHYLNWKNTKACSLECRTKYNQKRQSERRKQCNLASRLGLSGGKIGKINEYIVAIDLLKKGYEVYIAFEDTHPFDILALKDNKYTRIEVKTGIVLPSGLITHKLKESQHNKHDVLAVVTNLSEIKYIGELL